MHFFLITTIVIYFRSANTVDVRNPDVRFSVFLKHVRLLNRPDFRHLYLSIYLKTRRFFVRFAKPDVRFSARDFNGQIILSAKNCIDSSGKPAIKFSDFFVGKRIAL